ncbi:MAG: 5'/3'-nucleotidase SurE [Bacteroidetes bacterium HGW-Bacteroidetes-16]|jgi:5'-nucleotidase|nr:MAG: 5'/3'-nucleotidase SurE [Bacteroidetes bacterium HGW-Bacteroidetes-16]
MNRPTILISNDDGAGAVGLRKLILIMRKLGDVVAIVSENPMSGMGHAVTMQQPLRARLVSEEKGYKEYITNGTPVDNIKLGKHLLLKKAPDLVVSGINHGSNAAINVIYSGTMGAVLEASIDGIPAIGFSLDDYSSNACFDHTDKYIEAITRKVLKEGLPKGISLNVNLPAYSEKGPQGIKVCRQAQARWIEAFEERFDPYGRTYYWMGGRFENGDGRQDTDQKALADNFVAVVPTQFDFTAHQYVNELNFSL